MAGIKSYGIISPQKTAGNKGLPDSLLPFESNQLKAIEPDYKSYIPPAQLRRMSKILKMGLTASNICLTDSGITNPDAIIVGTALGGIEFLEKFMFSMIEKNEQTLSPTPFIQSTHNTIASQIALLLGNRNYNMTYTHRALSFEWALQDALLQLAENPGLNILVGGLDVHTDNHYKLYEINNLWKQTGDLGKGLLYSDSRGTIAGEGAVFFMLNGKKEGPQIRDLHTFIGNADVEYELDSFLVRNGLPIKSVDLLLLGISGDKEVDKNYYRLMSKVFQPEYTSYSYFKHLCGEYFTSSAFAVWLASVVLESGKVPDEILIGEGSVQKPETILIYNNYQASNHSFILLQKD